MRGMGALALFAMLAAAPAMAQTGPQLSYDQVLAPPAIQQVQQRLRDMGAYNGAVDGVWGNDSQAALQQFQQSHGLQVTGQLNQATAALLNLNPTELLAAAQPAAGGAPPPGQGRPLTSAEIRNLEARLRTLGYYHGPIDGVWGQGMQNSLSRYQQASGIQVTGRLNPQTVQAMGLNPDDLTAPAR